MDEFRGDVIRASTKRIEPMTRGLGCGQPKICKFDCATRNQQDVLKLQVSVVNVQLMAIIEPRNDLRKNRTEPPRLRGGDHY